MLARDRVVACAIAALVLSACDFEEAEQSATAAAVQTCSTADQAWRSERLGPGFTQVFRIELDATPSVAPTDAVIGLAANAPSSFAQLAAIVRFNNAGSIDVRDGGAYRVDRAVSYQAGVTYRLRIEVDVPRHTYSVDLRRPDGVTWERIARRYAFRTEQASVFSLAFLATKLDGAGTLALCHDDALAAASTCELASAGNGFVNTPVTRATNVIVAQVTATPSTTLDGVHGLSLGAADAFGDLAAAFRFTPSGTIDARDGDTYRADTASTYVPGAPHRVRIIADLASHTYSVQAARDYEAFEIARSHRFRTQQASVAALDNLAGIVDSAAGSVEVCDTDVQVPEVLFRRAGTHAVVADANLISDGTTTQRIDSRGATLASFAAGGELAVDSAGNIYIARVTGSSLVVDSLTAAFAPRWTRTFAAAGPQVLAVGVTAANDITIAMRDGVRQLTAAGVSRWTRAIGSDYRVLPNRGGYALVLAAAGNVVVEQRDRDANFVWSRSWPNNVTIDQIATNPAGQILFGGFYSGPINFGGATFEAYPGQEDGPRNCYIVALSPTGEHVFSSRMSEKAVSAIASNGMRTVVAAHHYLTPIWTTRYTFDTTGALVDTREGLAGFGWFGRTYRLALSSAGRVFWSYGPSWPDNFTEWPQLVAY